MKMRLSFVTNSSSSSYIICCSEVLDKKALIEYLQEEYGRRGNGILNYITSGKEVKAECEHINSDLYLSQSDVDLVEDDKEYLFAYEDIEDSPGCSAAMAYDVSHKSLRSLFSGSYSGYDG